MYRNRLRQSTQNKSSNNEETQSSTHPMNQPLNNPMYNPFQKEVGNQQIANSAKKMVANNSGNSGSEKPNNATKPPVNETEDDRSMGLNEEVESNPLLLEDIKKKAKTRKSDVLSDSEYKGDYENEFEVRKKLRSNLFRILSTNKFKDVSKVKKTPRTRTLHSDSEGESESEDNDIVYRSLRHDENVVKDGLRPPEGHDKKKTAATHISAGSRAKIKSEWVSMSRSIKVVGAWASEGSGRVAKIRIPKSKREAGEKGNREVYDMTDEEQAKEVFPKGGMGLTTAKSSQEVVVKGGVSPVDIMALYAARKIKEQEYNDLKVKLKNGESAIIDGLNVYKVFRTRSKVEDKDDKGNKFKTTPDYCVLLELPFNRKS